MSAAPSVVRLGRTASTMDALHQLAQEGAVHGTAVVAVEQLTGRGSRGQGWSSPPGGAWVSVLARPQPAGLEVLSLRAGLAVVDGLDALELTGRLRVKWPNDLMLDDRKTGGILCEARWQGARLAWVVIGVGINVTNAPPAELAQSATRLADAVPGIAPEAVARIAIQAVRAIDHDQPQLTPRELEHLHARDWLRGRRLSQPVAGIAEGITADGALRVRRADGTSESVRAGGIVLAAAPGAA